MRRAQQEGPKRKARADSDAIQWKEYPRIAPGEYRAFCYFGKRYRDPGLHRWTCLLRWNVFSEDLQRTLAHCVPLWWSLGEGKNPRASRRGKYLREWVRANDGPPRKGQPALSSRLYAAIRESRDRRRAKPGSILCGAQNCSLGDGHSASGCQKVHQSRRARRTGPKDEGFVMNLCAVFCSLSGPSFGPCRGRGCNSGQNTPKGRAFQFSARPSKAKRHATSVSVTAAHSQAIDCKGKKGGCCPNVAH